MHVEESLTLDSVAIHGRRSECPHLRFGAAGTTNQLVMRRIDRRVRVRYFVNQAASFAETEEPKFGGGGRSSG